MNAITFIWKQLLKELKKRQEEKLKKKQTGRASSVNLPEDTHADIDPPNVEAPSIELQRVSRSKTSEETLLGGETITEKESKAGMEKISAVEKVSEMEKASDMEKISKMEKISEKEKKKENDAKVVEETKAGKETKTNPKSPVRLTQEVRSFLQEHYDFRYNLLTEETEFRPAGKRDVSFAPVGKRELNTFCMEAHDQGISCWDKDLSRYVYSTCIAECHPF